ncbi:putative transcription factor HSF-type-DNA-binding family [Lupinus albus]|uniref:Putative transcription factor HSF-type-DNA-binding family n=1 Tax=Lupinus albus TaxID=3870 RepID=A0A6A4R0U7_LUPAL|nr:putative transcription factor HSF-type-DNA-binding family [Lupinus albus]
MKILLLLLMDLNTKNMVQMICNCIVVRIERLLLLELAITIANRRDFIFHRYTTPGFCEGFRKIHTDKWEFFNEAFQRGKKHLLKNIQRRRSQQVGSYLGPCTDSRKSGVEVEIERLRKERSMLMKEVVDLQQQQRRTVHHAGEVNQRLQSAEQRQKQMVSFLAELFHNPAFLARLKLKKEQREKDSPRVRRKFVKQHRPEVGTSETMKEEHIVRYQPDWRNITISPETPKVTPSSIEHSPHYLSQDLATEINADTENLTPQIENIVTDELAAVQDITATQKINEEGSSSFGLKDHFFKGKNVMSPNEQVLPEYFVSFPMFSPLGTESIIKQEDIWDPDFNISGAASNCGNELWGNLINYQVPEFGVTSGISDFWDIGSGSFGIDKWLADDETPFDETGSEVGQRKDDRSKNDP